MQYAVKLTNADGEVKETVLKHRGKKLVQDIGRDPRFIFSKFPGAVTVEITVPELNKRNGTVDTLRLHANIHGKQTARQLECRESLSWSLNPGDTVYGIVRNVSRSGMSRQIDFYATGMVYISYPIADLCDYRQHTSGALKVGGCGMNMIFSVVYNLSYYMYGNGYVLNYGQL